LAQILGILGYADLIGGVNKRWEASGDIVIWSCSSAGQSNVLIRRGSLVQSQSGPPREGGSIGKTRVS
jgi:hypothetical protein